MTIASPLGVLNDPKASAEGLEGLTYWFDALRKAIASPVDPNELAATRNILVQKLSATPAPVTTQIAAGVLLGALRASPASALTIRMVSRLEALARWVFSGTVEAVDVEVLRRELAEGGFPQTSEVMLEGNPAGPSFLALMGGEGVARLNSPSTALEEEVSALKAEAVRQREAWQRVVEVFEQNAAVLRKALRDRGVDPDELLQAARLERCSVAVESPPG